MSWWTKNRKKVGLLAGLLGGGVGVAGLAGAGPLAGLLGGTGEAIGAGFAGASLPAGVAGPVTAGAKGAMGVGSALGGNLPQGSAMMAAQGAGLLSPQPEPQQPPPPPPPPAAPPPQSNFTGYGMQGDPFAGMTEEQKRRILAMMQQGGVR